MGESTQRLSASLKAGQPQVEWQDIGAFRNTLVHDYLDLKLKRIWQIIQDDLPAFKLQIDAMLQGISPS